MHKLIRITLAAALPVVWAAGCSDFLKGGELTNNPNNATTGTASMNQLFIPIQVNQFAQQNSEVAWSIAQWMQSLWGASRQQVGIYNYTSINNGTWDGDFNTVYTGGGLIDIRQLQTQAAAAPDPLYQGIALVMEGWMMGNAADWWGALPYSQAVNYTAFPTPVLDSQHVVYDSVLSKLNQGIALMGTGGAGPGTTDLVYGGSAAKWTALAHTLKARIMLHGVLAGWYTYAQVKAQADSGISGVSGANDYLAWFQTGIQLSSNNWYQFMSANGGSGRAGDMIANLPPANPDTTKIIKLMKAGNDPRLGYYFDSTNATGGGMSNARLASGYHQPLVTAAENLLISAEAKLHSGDAAGALTALQAEQASWAVANTWHPSLLVPLATVANDSTIGTEKYFALFQNVEVWNDWKRLCVPKLVPVKSIAVVGFTIPSRLLYGVTEQQTNPNIPPVGTPPNGPFNSNDTRKGCTQ